MFDLLKQYIARFLTEWIFAVGGTVLTVVGISHDQLLNIILGLISLAGAATSNAAHLNKSLNTDPKTLLK